MTEPIIFGGRNLTEVAEVVYGLGHPTRLWIMERLNKHPLHKMYLSELVNEIRNLDPGSKFGTVQSYVNKLAEAGIVSVEQDYTQTRRRRGMKMVTLQKYVKIAIKDRRV
jgi:DNA-binding transcriptional ArsR family regulator